MLLILHVRVPTVEFLISQDFPIPPVRIALFCHAYEKGFPIIVFTQFPFPPSPQAVKTGAVRGNAVDGSGPRKSALQDEYSTKTGMKSNQSIR